MKKWKINSWRNYPVKHIPKYEDEKDLNLANQSQKKYQEVLSEAGFGEITTEIKIFNTYFLAEDYHQQYLAKNPNGYCGLGGTGCAFPNN